LPLSKTVKNIILAFTILCGLFLIVFSIELFLLNRGAGDEGEGPSLSAEAPDGTGNDGTVPGSDGSDPADADQPDGATEPDGTGNQPGNTRPAPTGVRRERPVSSDTMLVFYTDGEMFEQIDSEQEDVLDVFTYKGGGNAAIQISYVYIISGAEEYAADFLYHNFGVEMAEVGEEDYIGLSPLRGVPVAGANDGIFYEAWIYSLTDPELDKFGVAFVISYENNTQRNALYDILDSLDILSNTGA